VVAFRILYRKVSYNIYLADLHIGCANWVFLPIANKYL